MYLSIFYTLILQVNPFHGYPVARSPRSGDAVNDPIIGAIVDFARPPKGGSSSPVDPRLLLPLWQCCILGFVNECRQYQLRPVWAYMFVTIALYAAEALYTCVNVPSVLCPA